MNGVNFSISLVILPLLTSIFLWISRPFLFMQRYKMALWTSFFSCIWCLCWIGYPIFFPLGGETILLYVFFLMHLSLHRNCSTQENPSFSLSSMFVHYTFITGISIATSFRFQWILSCGAYLCLAYGLDIKNRWLWGVLIFLGGVSRVTLTLVCGIIYSCGTSFLFKPKRSSLEYIHWIQWIFGLLYVLSARSVQPSLYSILQGGIILGVMGVLFYKQNYAYGRFLVHMLSIQWMCCFIDNKFFLLVYLACMQWAHYIVYHDENRWITKNDAGIGSGILLGSCASGALWGMLHAVRYYRGIYYGEYILYVLCCVMYSKSIYSKLYRRKYNKYTFINVYTIFFGTLVWNIFNGFYLSQNILL
ncbi:hypothetical protein [Holospora curviuscula]|uniref:Uncharacterized protein n=1 Tax=Holospora curviuscula TaxID=1082868 RepID=A0A2S5R777_9PROT|nr:hypothetical protein [Holospora curviuscula]PPE03178.1 hypothetical protein HCUR_01378 [Holospora curviuscula]